MSEYYGPTPAVGTTQPLVRFIHGGETVDYTPVADVAAGAVVVLGNFCGIAKRAIAANKTGALAIEGSMDFPKAASDGGMAVGTAAYWDASAQVATGTAASNNYIGKVEIAAATADTTVRIQVESMANASGNIGFGVVPSATVAAAGSTQSDAAAIATGFTLVSAADATKGVKLPTAAAGKMCIVKNADAANAVLKIWPFSGDAINAISADSAMSIAAKTSVILVAYDATTWYTIPLLPS